VKKMTTIVAALLALFAFPVVADARGGHGGDHGPAQAEHGQRGDHQTLAGDDTETTGQTADDPTGEQPAPAPVPRRCRRPQSVGFVAKGSLTSFTAEAITLDVKRANPHARRFIQAAGSEFTLGTARVKFAGVTDADSNGTVDFADVLPTDRVTVVGKATRPKRGCEGDAALTLRRVQVVRPKADPAPADADESGSQS
jgi:hypothetical protein